MVGDRYKICMITTFYPPYNFGGDGIQVQRLAEALAHDGHDVHVIHSIDAYRALGGEVPFPSEAGPSFPTSARPGSEESGVVVHPLQSRAGTISPLLSQQTGYPFLKSQQIQEILRKHTFDVIHFHNISLFGPAVLKLGNAIKLYTTHEHWLICPMHVLWKFDREVCEKPTCFRCQIAGRRPPQWWRYTSLLKNSLKQIDCIICPSHFTRIKHQEAGIERPIENIPHFVPELLKAETIRADYPRPYFFCAGRLEKLKGFQNAIEVFKSLQEIDLLIAGAGDFENELHKMSEGFPNIRFLGKLNSNEIHNYYQGAVGVIVPSLCYEVFGLVILEAFQHGVPVIAHDLGALGEIVKQSNGGLLYTSNQELKEHVQQLATNLPIRSRLAQNGYTAYKTYWTEKAHLDQYLKLIRKLQYERRTLQGLI